MEAAPTGDINAQLPSSDSATMQPDAPSPVDNLNVFEAYSRRVLPGLIEAHVIAALNLELQQFESDLKNVIKDTVGECQSIVHRKFERLSASGHPAVGPGKGMIPNGACGDDRHLTFNSRDAETSTQIDPAEN